MNKTPVISPMAKRIESLSSKEGDDLDENWRGKQKNFQLIFREESKNEKNSENLGSDGVSADSKRESSLIKHLEEDF